MWREMWEEIKEIMSMKKKNKVLAVIIGNIASIAFLVLCLNIFYIPSMNTPEQQAYVAVAGKRIYADDEGYITFLISFKFSDGSIKAFDEGRDGVSNSERGLVYESINEGEKGLLTYKDGGRFISFEKDLEYGGEKIETYQISEKSAVTLLISVFAIVLALFNIHIIFVVKTAYPKRVQAKLLEKGKCIDESEDGEDSYTIKYATFKLADGTRHKLVVYRKKTHDSLRVNETGILTYEKSSIYNRDKLVKFECMRNNHLPQNKPPNALKSHNAAFRNTLLKSKFGEKHHGNSANINFR